MSPEGVDQGFVMGLFCKDSFHGFFCLRGLKGSMPPAFNASRFMLRVSMLRVSGVKKFKKVQCLWRLKGLKSFRVVSVLRVSCFAFQGCAFQCFAFQSCFKLFQVIARRNNKATRIQSLRRSKVHLFNYSDVHLFYGSMPSAFGLRIQ